MSDHQRSEFARGGLITGPGSAAVPAIRECGYVLPARAARELGPLSGVLAKLNARDGDQP